MARPLRIHANALLYHVFSRGNNKESIFFEKENYKRFFTNLEKYRTKLNYKLFAYCLLPNHFHLLIQVATTSISKIMQVLITAYSMYINKKYQRIGHLFQGRFKSIVVDKDAYLLQVHRYIHLNPVKAGLVKFPELYSWSSYPAFLEISPNFPTLETKEIYERFSHSPVRQKQLLHEFTLSGLTDKFDPFKNEVRGILGDRKFQQKITKVLKGVRP